MIIREILAEELERVTQLKAQYEADIAKLPKGKLVKKHIRGQEYYYRQYRENCRVHYPYLGKLSAAEISECQQAYTDRQRYLAMIKELKERIRFLERALRGRNKTA